MVFGLTFGIAVGLGRTPPPPPVINPWSRRSLSATTCRTSDPGPRALRLALRSDVRHAPPSCWPAASAGVGGYAAAVTRGRSVARSPGCRVVWFCCSPRPLVWADTCPRCSACIWSRTCCCRCWSPVLLVLGATGHPGAAGVTGRRAAGPPGPREWLLAALHSRLSRFLTHPVVAAVLFVAGFYGLYFVASSTLR